MRKVLGGSMRQVGILASACLLALSRAKENMTKDHENAKKLAHGIESCLNPAAKELFRIDAINVQTNIVHLGIVSNKLDSNQLVKRLSIVSFFGIFVIIYHYILFK